MLGKALDQGPWPSKPDPTPMISGVGFASLGFRVRGLRVQGLGVQGSGSGFGVKSSGVFCFWMKVVFDENGFG